jgi:hypothetical protein
VVEVFIGTLLESRLIGGQLFDHDGGHEAPEHPSHSGTKGHFQSVRNPEPALAFRPPFLRDCLVQRSYLNPNSSRSRMNSLTPSGPFKRSHTVSSCLRRTSNSKNGQHCRSSLNPFGQMISAHDLRVHLEGKAIGQLTPFPYRVSERLDELSVPRPFLRRYTVDVAGEARRHNSYFCISMKSARPIRYMSRSRYLF